MAKHKDSDESNLQELFEEEMKKPYYKVNYLDDFKLPYEKLDVTMLIATYNRCPYKPGTLKEINNPLVWGIKSCLIQKPKVKKIVIVDDNSTDYTKEIVEKYEKISKEKYGIDFVYIKNSEQLGPGVARNEGVTACNSKYIYFLDDDCFIPPYTVFGSVYTLEKVQEKGYKIGVVNLPTYQRMSLPKMPISKQEIGNLDFRNGLFQTNKDCFPEEYLEAESQDKFLDNELHILKPFPILNLNTNLLCLKSMFEEIGGFRKHFLNRGEDREFGCRILENGYQIYFQPDPKFQCVHGSYGLHLNKKFKGEDWLRKIDKSISLTKAMKLCDDQKGDSGTRVNPLDYIQQTMIADFFLTYVRNKKGSMNWMKRTHDEFVVKGDKSYVGNNEANVPVKEKRLEIWRSAIDDGIKMVKLEEERNLKEIKETIKDLYREEKEKGSVLLND